MSNIELPDLKVGVCYRIDFSDCCIAGVLIGKLLEIRNEDDPDEIPEYIFSWGKLTRIYAHTIENIEVVPDFGYVSI